MKNWLPSMVINYIMYAIGTRNICICHVNHMLVKYAWYDSKTLRWLQFWYFKFICMCFLWDISYQKRDGRACSSVNIFNAMIIWQQEEPIFFRSDPFFNRFFIDMNAFWMLLIHSRWRNNSYSVQTYSYVFNAALSNSVWMSIC